MAKKVFVVFAQPRRKGNGNGSEKGNFAPLTQWPVVCASLGREGFTVLSSRETINGFPSRVAIGVDLGTSLVQQATPFFAQIQKDFRLPPFRKESVALFEE